MNRETIPSSTSSRWNGWNENSVGSVLRRKPQPEQELTIADHAQHSGPHGVLNQLRIQTAPKRAQAGDVPRGADVPGLGHRHGRAQRHLRRSSCSASSAAWASASPRSRRRCISPRSRRRTFAGGWWRSTRSPSSAASRRRRSSTTSSPTQGDPAAEPGLAHRDRLALDVRHRHRCRRCCSALLLIPIPESPRWLIERKREDEARRDSATRSAGAAFAAAELASIKAALSQEQGTWGELFSARAAACRCSSASRWPSSSRSPASTCSCISARPSSRP